MSQSKLSDYKNEIISYVHDGLNNTEIAEKITNRYGIEVSRHAVRRLKTKLNLDKGADKQTTKFDGNQATIISDAGIDISDPEKVVRDRGLDPTEWDYNGVTINEWDSPTGETLRQLKINLVRKTPVELILPARVDGPKWETPKPKPIPETGALFVISGDDQAPFHDPLLHEKKCQFLEYLRDETNLHTNIKIGDTNDFPDISKYKKNPEQQEKAKVQDCVNGGYDILFDERQACGPDVRILKLIGNHDVRLRDYQLAQVPEFYGLTRARMEEAPVLSIQHLMRLDELGVELVGDNEQYEHGEVKLSKYLAARHGWIATKGSGSSALKTLDHLGYSILVGHTHRLSLVYKTTHDIDGELAILAAAETGCLCRVDKKGLGFAPSPDWQNGFATAEVYPDGTFHIDLVNWINKSLYWRGMRF